jgi:DNA-binding CsgD family transcriptional regulator
VAEVPAATRMSAPRVAGSSKALLVVDDDCVCVEASLGACTLLGTARSELVGRDLESLLEAESRERFAHVWLAFRDRGGHAEPFALEAPARVVEVAATVDSEILPARHLVTLKPVDARSGRRFSDAPEPPGPRSPTVREREILELLAGGRTDGQIAALLELSPATVQTHVRNAKSKLGARTRAQAVAIALQRGLIAA